MVKSRAGNFTEVLIIGGGPGGYVAAIRAAQLGKEVTLVDKSASLGGVCIKYGCIPSKALIHIADLTWQIQEMEDLGLKVQGLKIDLAKIQEWKRNKVVGRLTKGLSFLCDKNGIEFIQGEASFESVNRVNLKTEDGGQRLEFQDAIIASGSTPLEVPGFKFDEDLILSSKEALALTQIPERLAVIGGGYIGLELGTVYAKLGSKVTVIEMMDQLLPGTPKELVGVIQRKLRKLSVGVHLNSKAKRFEITKEGVVTKAKSGNEEISVESNKVLVTVGRRPFTAGLGLNKIGVKLDGKGFIKVDQRLRTNLDHIYAIGDVVGQPMLAHKASWEGEIAAEVIAGNVRRKGQQPIPAVIFTDPEIATVGMTEEEAEENGYVTITGKFPFTASGRALTTGETEGFIKVVADRDSHRMLGAQMVGPEASDMISEATLAIQKKTTLEEINRTVHPHPTYPESFREACESALKRAIHILNR